MRLLATPMCHCLQATPPRNLEPGTTGARRGALLAGLGAASLGATAYWRLVPDERVGGVVVHARARELPLLRFTDENGAATSLADFRDRVVLLNVWATWCPPCREEMPTRDRLQARVNNGGDASHSHVCSRPVRETPGSALTAMSRKPTVELPLSILS